MSFADWLTLTTVQVTRITETSNGMGGSTSVSSVQTLTRALIWQAGSANRYLSDKVTKDSTHVLAIETGEYSFTDNDRYVNYDSKTFKITGHADDIAERGELTIIGLERLT